MFGASTLTSAFAHLSKVDYERLYKTFKRGLDKDAASSVVGPPDRKRFGCSLKLGTCGWEQYAETK
jgi:hypothetical protein